MMKDTMEYANMVAEQENLVAERDTLEAEAKAEFENLDENDPDVGRKIAEAFRKGMQVGAIENRIADMEQ